MSAEWKIEKGISPVSVPAFPKYPFKEMQIGDSFFIESGKFTEHERANVRAAARAAGVGIITRRPDGGLRVWRVA